MNTLVLNASYEVLKIVSWKKALSLFFLNKIEVIEEYDQEVHSVSAVFKIPSVVRLVKMVRPKYKAIKFNRINLWARDSFSCQYCGKKLKSQELTMDHIISRSAGGKSSWANCVCCCPNCNMRKGDKTLKEAGMVLRKEPVQPSVKDYFTISITIKNNTNDLPESWKTYLDFVNWNADIKDE